MYTIPLRLPVRAFRDSEMRSLLRDKQKRQPHTPFFSRTDLAECLAHGSQSRLLGRNSNSYRRERSVKIKLKNKKIYFENKSNTILKIKDLAAKMK